MHVATVMWLCECTFRLLKFIVGTQISLDGFLKFMGTKFKEVESAEEVIQAFRVFDKDGKGLIGVYSPLEQTSEGKGGGKEKQGLRKRASNPCCFHSQNAV